MVYSRYEMWMVGKIWQTRSRWSGLETERHRSSKRVATVVIGWKMVKRLHWDVYLPVIIEYWAEKQNIQLIDIKIGNFITIISKIMNFNFLAREYTINSYIFQMGNTLFHRYKVTILPNDYHLYDIIFSTESECHIWARQYIEVSTWICRKLQERELN